MDSKIVVKLFVLAALLFAGTACQQRYELHLPLALNREKMDFKKGGASYYVLVYTDNGWSASLDKDAPWLELSRSAGSGDSQIMITAQPNDGPQREAVLTVEDGTASKTMLITQESGIEED